MPEGCFFHINITHNTSPFNIVRFICKQIILQVGKTVLIKVAKLLNMDRIDVCGLIIEETLTFMHFPREHWIKIRNFI